MLIIIGVETMKEQRPDYAPPPSPRPPIINDPDPVASDNTSLWILLILSFGISVGIIIGCKL